jgi:hypothetical protein
VSTGLVVDKLGNIIMSSVHIDTYALCFLAGAINMMVPMTSVAAIATYAWPFVRTKDGLIAITVLYG